MDRDVTIYEKSLDFAVRIVKLSQHLQRTKREQVMSEQILRSGASIGANVREAKYGQSRNDFIAKMSIALKETSETEYWLELLARTGYLTEEEHKSMSEDCMELLKLLTSIVKSTRNAK